MKSQRGTEVQIYSFFNLSAQWGMGGRCHAPGHFIPEKDQAFTVQEGGWMGDDDLTPTIVQTPNHPARSESVHQLHCPSPKTVVIYDDNINLKSKRSGFQHVYFNFINHSSIQILMTHLVKPYNS
jgi:hypothetical protein